MNLDRHQADSIGLRLPVSPDLIHLATLIRSAGLLKIGIVSEFWLLAPLLF